MPIYPFFAMFIGYTLWHAGIDWIKLSLKWLLVLIIIRYVLGIFWFPYNQLYHRGNAKKIAQDILTKTNDYPLYINDSAAKGLRLGAELDMLIYPKKPLISKHHAEPNFSGFIIRRNPKKGDCRFNG